MELLGVMFVLAVLGLPIWVIVRIVQLGHEVLDLRQQLATLRRAVGEAAPQSRTAAAPAPAPAAPSTPAPEVVRPAPAPPKPVTPVQPAPAAPPAPAPAKPTPPPAPAPASPSVSEPARPAPRPQPAAPAPSRPAAPARPPAPAPARAAAAAAPPAPPRPPRPTVERPGFDIEEVLGANWMAKLGVIALAIATVLFLKYSMDQGWIGPWARVCIGLAASGTLYGLGQWQLRRPRYRAYAQVLAAGGVLIFFLSVYAAYALYQLINYGTAFGILAVGALAASAVAVPSNTQAIAALCLAGAYVTPVLIRRDGAAGGELFALYLYLALVDVWTAVLVKLRAWPALLTLAWAATWLIFFGAGGFTTSHPWSAVLFAGLFLSFSCYVNNTLLRLESSTEKDWPVAGIVVMLGGFLGFGIASALLLAHVVVLGLPGLALIGVPMALLAAALPYTLRGEGEIGRGARELLRGLAAVTLAIVVALPVLTAPVMSAAQAPGAFLFGLVTYLLFLGVTLDLGLRQRAADTALFLLIANALTHGVVTFHTLAPLQVRGVEAVALWLPLAGWIGLLAVPLLRREQALTGVQLWLAQLFTFAGLATVVAWAHSWPVGSALVLFGGEFLLLSLTWTALRSTARLEGFRGDLFGAWTNAALFFTMLACVAGLEQYRGFVILCGCALGMAAYHALLGAWLRQSGDEVTNRITHLALAVTFAVLAVPLQFRHTDLTAIWAAEAVALIATGVALRAYWLRWYGAALAMAVLVKALALDLPVAPSPYHPLLNPRFLSGLCVSGALALGGLLYWRRREQLAPNERLLPVMGALLGTLVALTFASFELYQYLGFRVDPAAAKNAQQAGLTVFWCVGALVTLFAALRANSRPMRALALALLGLALTKALVADLAMDPVFFRTFANARMACGWAALVACYTAVWLLRREAEAPSRDLRSTLLVLGSVFTVAYLTRDFWQTFAPSGESAQFLSLALFWSVYATAVLFVAQWRANPVLRSVGLSVLLLAVLKAAFVDLLVEPRSFLLLANTRVGCGLAAIAACYAAVWLLRQEVVHWLRQTRHTLLVVASAFTVAYLSRDLWQASAASGGDAQYLSLTLFWSAYAVAVLLVAQWRGNAVLRGVGLSVLLLTIGKAVLDMTIDPVPFHLLANARIWCGLAVIAASYLTVALLRDEKGELAEEVRPALLLLANLYTLVFVSMDLWQYFGQPDVTFGGRSAQQLSLSIFWSCYALIVLCVGIWRRARLVRLFAMGLLYLSIFKVFLLDLSFLETPYRIASFFGLGVILLVVSLLYTRFEAQVHEGTGVPGVSAS